MKKIFSFIILSFIICNIANSQVKKIRFGKTQYYKPIKNEVETKIEGVAVKVYDKLYQDTLEIPLNRYFKSDSVVVFVGVSFRYSVENLYNILSLFNNPISKSYDAKNKSFIIQGFVNKAFVSRYCYQSKKDNLIYIINYSFLPNKQISMDEFKKIINETIKK